MDVQPFKIQVPEETLADLKERLAQTRWPDELPGTGWDYGTNMAYLKELVDYWQNSFDWRAQEEAINRFSHFKADVDGLGIHFIHQKGVGPDPMPLVLTHGWPGSVVEFHKVIEPLADPTAHGGNAEDAFHVVVPSLPGFGFSEMPKERGWNQRRISEVIAKLMARLQYDQYGAQGGDWGAGIVRWLAANDGAHCIGSHSNFPPSSAPRSDVMRGVSEVEIERFRRRRC